jgi:hypothetical protein
MPDSQSVFAVQKAPSPPLVDSGVLVPVPDPGWLLPVPELDEEDVVEPPPLEELVPASGVGGGGASPASAARRAPLGVPRPLGPSHPVATLQSFPQELGLLESVLEPLGSTGYELEPRSLNAEAFVYGHARFCEIVSASPRRVMMAATRGDAALVPSTDVQPCWYTGISTSWSWNSNAAAAEKSAVARLLQLVPERDAICHEGALNSVLQPLVVMSCPFCPVLNVPSFHTASSYELPLNSVVPPMAITSGAEAG